MKYDQKVITALGSLERGAAVLQISKDLAKQLHDNDWDDVQFVEAVLTHPGLHTEFERLWVTYKLAYCFAELSTMSTPIAIARMFTQPGRP